MSGPRWRLGLRGEFLALLVGALVLLILISTFTLFSHRNALALLADERKAAAAEIAAEIAAALPADRLPAVEELRRLAPRARGVALVDSRGRALVAWGSLDAGEGTGSLLAPLAGRPLDRAVGAGPGGVLPDAIAGFAPLVGSDGRRVVRLDLAAGALAPQVRAVNLLAAVVLTVNGGLVLLLVLFLRQLVTPFDRLVERARQLGGDQPENEDDVALLRRTLERAVAALAAGEGERAAAEDDISALRRTLATSLESGVLLLDREGAVVALNRVGADLLGVTPPAAGEAPPVGEVFAPHPELAGLLVDAVAGGGGVQRRELAIETPGGRRTLGLTVHLLRRDDGGVRGYLVLFADLTESRRRAREAQLAENLEGLGELAAGVAHELRNSLATFRGYLTLIDRAPGEESIADYLGEIRRETDHLQRVLEDFLTFARPGSARAEPIELAVLARRAAADPALGEEVAIRDDAGPGATLHGDPQLLERAIRNLLHNACRAEREAGRAGPVEVTLLQTEGGVELRVDDRGGGVPETVRERLFRPFVTGSSTGVGLGLALVHRIVTLHGGGVRLEDRPGGGTRAVLSLPADLPPAEGEGGGA